MPKRTDQADIDEIMEILGDAPLSSEYQYTLEEILNDSKKEAIDNPIKSKPSSEKPRKLQTADMSAVPAPQEGSAPSRREDELPSFQLSRSLPDEYAEDAGARRTLTEAYSKDSSPKSERPPKRARRPRDGGESFPESEPLLAQDAVEAPTEDVSGEARAGDTPRGRDRQATVQLSAGEELARIAPALKNLRGRLIVVLVLCVPALLMTFAPKLGLTLPGALTYLEKPYTYLFICCLVQTAAVFCGVGLVANGLRRIFRLRPNYESAVALAELAILMHTLSILWHGDWGGYYPYSTVGVFLMLFAIWGERLRLLSRHSSLKAAAAAPMFAVMREETAFQGGAAILKYPADSTDGFTALLRAEDAGSRFSSFFTPIALIAALLFAVLSSFGKGEPQLFFWAYAAIMSVVAPFTAALSFNLPFAMIAKKLSYIGASIAGWTAARMFAADAAVILTDRDLFPAESVSFNGLKVFGGHQVERIINYTASIIEASGCGLYDALKDIMQGQASVALYPVTDLLHYEGGGVGGEIGGDKVLVGTANFMLRMGVRIPKSVNVDNPIFTAVNYELSAVFAVLYKPAGSVRKGFGELLRQRLLPVLATRDFGVTPTLLTSKFNLATEDYEFPQIEERLELSDPGRERFTKPAALLSREGLFSYAEAVCAGKRLFFVTRINLMFTALCGIIGIFLMFYLAFNFAFSSASPANVLVYLSLWLIPVVVMSNSVKQY